MEYEVIIKEWKAGHSKKWLIDEEYKSLMWLKKNRGAFKYSKLKEIKQQASRNIEEALLKWWKEEILKEKRKKR